MDYLNHLYGRNIKRIKEIDGGTIHKIKTHNQGICYITAYQIFSGVSVMFNDIRASKFDMVMKEHADGIQRYELNHCREGKFESILKDGTKISFEAGDFAINPFGKDSYRDPKRITVAWVITSLTRAAHGMSEIWFFKEAFLKTSVTPEQVEVQTRYYTDAKWVLFSLALTAVAAVLGCYLGNKMTEKHFKKTGIIQ